MRRTILTLSSSTGEAESEVRMIEIVFDKLTFAQILIFTDFNMLMPMLQGLIIRGPLIDMN